MLRALLAAVLVALACVPAALGSAPVDPYRGLGTWVDAYDTSYWTSPETTVSAIAARGVKTLYLETGNSRQPTDLVRPDRLARFVDSAHQAGLRVVGWYLPSLLNPKKDLRRSLAAIGFRTAAGGAFDSFALDIEASDVKSVPKRTARLLSLSQQIRSAVGAGYALGAITPSPRGMEIRPDYWPAFPYAQLAGLYDVFLPMVYTTYHGDGKAIVVLDVTRSMQILRQATGRPALAIHLIGGLGNELSKVEAKAFVSAAAACHPIGYSLYDFSVTKESAWRAFTAPPADTTISCG